MITPSQTADGQPLQIVTCDGEGCPVKIHALSAPAVERAERILRPDWTGRHYCPACQVRRGPGIAERPCPDPEHG